MQTVIGEYNGLIDFSCATQVDISDEQEGARSAFPIIRRRWLHQSVACVLDYRGSVLAPIRNSSTARAHCRPSRMAQTTSDCPRRISPAAKTLATEVR